MRDPMSERIRWQDAEHNNIVGYVGTIDDRVFKLQHPVLAGQRWVLTTDLPGWLNEVVGGTPGELKARAEQALEEFVSSLGAIFPDPELPECDRCEKAITGTPVTDPDDPMGRTWCSGECADASAEAAYEQQYRPGVAT